MLQCIGKVDMECFVLGVLAGLLIVHFVTAPARHARENAEMREKYPWLKEIK